jgi:hypothetical protein
MNPAGAKEDNKKDEDKRDPILAPLPNNHSLEDIHEYAGKPGRKRPSPFRYSDCEILRKKRAQGKGRTGKKKSFKVKNDAATPDGKPNQANAVIRGSELLAPLKMNPLIRRTPSPYNKEAEEKQVPRGGTRLQKTAVPCRAKLAMMVSS